MSKSFNQEIRKEITRHRKAKRNRKILGAACAVVACVTLLGSSFPASTATADLLCGKEEHKHTEECYEIQKVLICGHDKDGITQEKYDGLESRWNAAHGIAPVSGDAAVLEEESEEAASVTEEAAENTESSAAEDTSEAAEETTAAETAASESGTESSESTSENTSGSASESTSESASESTSEDTSVSTSEDAGAESSAPEESSTETSEETGEAASESAEEAATSEEEEESTTAETDTGDRIIEGIDLDTVHVHSDSCYEEKKVLICGKEEHEHTEACYEQGGTITGSKDDVTVTITYDAGEIEKGTSVILDGLVDDDRAKAESLIQDDLKEESTEEQSAELVDFYPCHMQLEKDGGIQNPNGMVDAAVAFSEARSSEDGIEWRLYYVTDDDAEDLGDEDHGDNELEITTDDNDDVTDISFQTDQFQYFVLAAVKTGTEEKKLPTSLTAEADGVKASMKFEEGAVEEGTTLQIAEDTDRKDSIQALLETELSHSESENGEISLLKFYPYSIELQNPEGAKVEPSSKVETTLKFDPALTTGDENAVWYVYRLKDDGTLENITDSAVVSTDDSSAVTELSFSADHFSDYILACVKETTDAAKELKAQGDGLTVTLQYESGVIEDGTEFQVSQIRDEDAVSEAFSRINEQNSTTDKASLLVGQITMWDFTLIHDMEEVEPDGTVKVTIDFDEPQTCSFLKEWGFYHLTDDAADDLTDDAQIVTDDSSAVTSITFSTDHFSEYALTGLRNRTSARAVRRLASSPSNNAQAGGSLLDYVSKVNVRGESGTLVSEVKEGEECKIEVKFEIPASTNPPAALTYELPSEYFTIKAADSGLIFQNGNSVGTYEISESGVVTLNFDTSRINLNNSVKGTIRFAATVAYSGEETEFHFNDEQSTTVIINKKAENNESIQKTISSSKETADGVELSYKVEVTTASQTEDTIDISDVFSYTGFSDAPLGKEDYQNIDISITKADGTAVTSGYTIEATDSGFQITGLPGIKSPDKYIITYTVTVPKDKINAADGSGKIENKAHIEDTNSYSSVSYDTWNPLYKTGTDDGNRNGTINWKITVVKPDSNDWKLTDILKEAIGANTEYQDFTGTIDESSIQVKALSDGTAALAHTVSGNRIEFVLQGDPGRYEITYTTRSEISYSDTVKEIKIKNTVEDEHQHDSDSEVTYTDTTVDKSDYTVSKQYDESESRDIDSGFARELAWESVEEFPSRSGSFLPDVDTLTFTDNLTVKGSSDSDYRADGNLHYVTEDLLNKTLKVELLDKDDNVLRVLVNGQDYMVYNNYNGQIVADSTNTSKQYTGFKVYIKCNNSPLDKNKVVETFPEEACRIRYSYHTIATVSQINPKEMSMLFHNESVVGDDHAHAETEVVRDEETKLVKNVKDANGNYSKESSLNYKPGSNTIQIAYRIVALCDSSQQSITIKDALSSENGEFSYDKDSFEIHSVYPINYDRYYFNTTGSGSHIGYKDAETGKMGDLYTDCKIDFNDSSDQFTATIGFYSDEAHTNPVNFPDDEWTLEGIALTYKVNVDVNKLFEMGGSAVCTNSADYEGQTDSTKTTVNSDNLYKSVTETSTREINNTYTQTDSVSYRLIINPGAEDLLPESDTLAFEDTLTDNDQVFESLDLSSIHLYRFDPSEEDCIAKDDSGSPISIDANYYHLSVDPDNRKISMTLRDGMAYVLVYTYDLDYIGTDEDYSGSLTNKASLSGDSTASSSTEIKEQTSSVTVWQGILHVYKLEKDFHENALEGVRFSLSQYDASTQSWVGATKELSSTTESVSDWITDANGKLVLESDPTKGLTSPDPITEDKLFYLQETENNNEGFADWESDEHAFYIFFNDTSESDETAYSEYLEKVKAEIRTAAGTASDDEVSNIISAAHFPDAEDVLFIDNARELIVENTRRQITVQKTWLDDDNNETTVDRTVKIKLYRSETPIQDSNGKTIENPDPELIESTCGSPCVTVTLSKDKDFKYTWDLAGEDDIPNDKLKDGYTYYAVEENVSGYQVSYIVNGVQSGTIKISNKHEKGVISLPATGGSGTAPYMASGLVLIIMAAFMYMIRKHAQQGRR